MVLCRFVFTTDSAKSDGETYQRSESCLRFALGLHSSIEGLAGRRGGFVIFDEAGGGRGVRGEVGPCAGHAGGALQAVGDIGRAGEADEQAAAAVSLDGEVNGND